MFEDQSLIIQESSPQSLSKMSRPLQRKINREIGEVVKHSIVANTHEEARAHLAYQALQNTAMLSAMEEHFIKIAPLGSARYEHIVDAFVLGSSRRLMKW